MRILVTSNSLVGHWLPLLPLVRAAQAAGHEVVVATGPDLVPDVQRRGVTAWPVGPDLATTQAGVRGRPRPDDETPEEATVRDGMAMFAVPAIARARDLRRLTADWAPDVVVREIYEVGGAFVPARLHVLHGLGAHYPGFVPLAERAIAQVAATVGPPAEPEPLGALPYVDPFPAVLHAPDEAPWSDVLPLRPDAGEVLPGDALPASVAALDPERTVYLTLGTLFGGPAELVVPLAGLAGLATPDGAPFDVVVTTGRAFAPADLGPLPPQVVVQPYVPQALLLPRSRAVVCHAGAGTVLGALAYARPLVLLPRGADQFANAAAVGRAGAAVVLPPPEVTAEAVRDAAVSVLDDPSYAAAALALSQHLAAMPPAAAVLDEILARTGARG